MRTPTRACRREAIGFPPSPVPGAEPRAFRPSRARTVPWDVACPMKPDPSATPARSKDIAGAPRVAIALPGCRSRCGRSGWDAQPHRRVERTPSSTSCWSWIVTRGLGGTATGLFFESIAVFHILTTAAQWGADVGVVLVDTQAPSAWARGADVRHSIAAALAPVVLAGIVFGAAPAGVRRSPWAIAHERHG